MYEEKKDQTYLYDFDFQPAAGTNRMESELTQ